MSQFRLLIQSLVFYWRSSLAVLLGVVAGTAVIGGALIVGDSVRGSLQQMTYDRLGKIDHVLTGPRFFREALVDDLAANAEFQKRFAAAAPALVLTAGIESAAANPQAERAILRVGKVTVYGVDRRLWNLLDHGAVAVPEEREGEESEIILSRRVARQLNAVQGKTVTVSIELPTTIPRDSLLGKRDATTISIPFQVKSVLGEESKPSRLNLAPNQHSPLIVFVSLRTLQRELGIHKRTIGRRRRRISKPARVNTVFVQARSHADRETDFSREAAIKLNTLFAEMLSPADLYLRVQKHTQTDSAREYLSLETEQQILSNQFADVGISAAKKLGANMSPVLVYLANTLIAVDFQQRFDSTSAIAGVTVMLARYGGDRNSGGLSHYSIVAGVDLQNLRQPPFGPFLTENKKQAMSLGKREIILNRWLADDLKVKPGDRIAMRFHRVGAHILTKAGALPEQRETFTVRGIVPLNGSVTDDRGFTPVLENITDVGTFDELARSLPFITKTPTQRDEEYWKKRGPTPKAFVSLQTAQELWSSRYGKLTSIRFAKIAGKSLDESAAAFTQTFLRELTPQQSGLIFRPVKYEGLQAAAGTTDFSVLFLSFSFFLILSATILIGLLFRLGIERRSSQIGLMQAVGFSPAQVRRLFLGESAVVVLFGGLIGIAAAWGYASVMIYGLKTWWVGAIGTQFLDVHVEPVSLLTGFAVSVLVAGIAVWWAMRQTRKLTSRDLLAGVTELPLSAAGKSRRGRRAAITAIVAAGLAILLLVCAVSGLIPAEEAFEGMSWMVVVFFLVGISLLIAGLAGLSWWLDSDRTQAVRGSGMRGIARLGLRNASRNRQRSVLTVALIASATFVIVAVAAGHRDPAVEDPVKSSGNGGFTLVAESSSPILHDLNTVAGRARLRLHFRAKAEDEERRGNGAEAKTFLRKAELLEKSRIIAFPMKPGEDASCLNIYQTHVPTMLGVPPAMIRRGGFKFINAKAENPWRLLEEKLPAEEGLPVYPVLGDVNTVRFSLHKDLNATIPIPDSANPKYRLKIVGLFDGSVFQGVLLISQRNFRNLYRDQIGYRYFLVETPVGATSAETKAVAVEMTGLLESQLDGFGFDAEPVADRLADFLAVQNTYLSTFQTLGGLGLLLGTLGLATVMLRNVLERRSELALLRAVGFQNSGLSGLVLWENTVLLVWGLLAGTVSALLAMTPHLMSTGASVPWAAVGWILGGVFAVGMIAASVAVRQAVRTPIISTLRTES